MVYFGIHYADNSIIDEGHWRPNMPNMQSTRDKKTYVTYVTLTIFQWLMMAVFEIEQNNRSKFQLE